MNIEEVRDFALSLSHVTEDFFADSWLSFRIGGKWFLLIQLDAPEPRIAVKLPPRVGETLREEISGVCPAYHLNKKHWNDLYIEQLDKDFICKHILMSYNLVFNSLPKDVKQKVEINLT